MSEIRNLLSELGITTAPKDHRHGREGWVQVCCPECDNGLLKFHLGISEKSVKANCWNCGPKNLPFVLTQLSGLKYADAQRALESLLPQSGKGTARWKPPAVLGLPAGLGRLLPAHRIYLKGRGFDPAEIRRIWRIKGIGISVGHMSWRIWIPIIEKGRVVSWTARAIGDDSMRYWSCDEENEIVRHKSILYGMDYVSSSAIVHEGPLDVWATGPGAVATFGTSFTNAQLRRLAKLRRVILCFDSSKDAQQRAHQLLNYLEPFPCECINVQIDAKDSADALLNNPKELERLRKFAFGKAR